MQPKYIFVRASVNSWKEKAEKYKNQDEAIMHKIGRSNLVEDDLLTKWKTLWLEFVWLEGRFLMQMTRECESEVSIKIKRIWWSP